MNVICVPGSYTYCAPPFSDAEFVGGDGTCSGDSGSSAFERSTYDQGAPVSLGVLSRGGAKGTQCTGSIYTRFDTKRDFVLAVGAEASGNWTLYPEPTWTVPKPAAVVRTADAGAVDASIPDASLCGADSCADDDAGPATTSSAAESGCNMGRSRSTGGGETLVPVALAGWLVRRRRRRT